MKRAVLISTIVCWAGSMVLLTLAGRGTPVFLLILFFGWVTLPFAALAIADYYLDRWSEQTRKLLASITLIVTIGSLLIYLSTSIWTVTTHAAAIWLMTPVFSWILIIAVVAISYFKRPSA